MAAATKCLNGNGRCCGRVNVCLPDAYLYLSFYNQITTGQSDLLSHALQIQSHVDGTNTISYPLWHEIVHALHRISNLPITISAVLINTLNALAYCALAHYFSQKLLGSETNILIIIIIIISCLFAGNFFLPELNITKNHFAGNGSISVWHNPTLFAVKPFALSSFFLFFIGLEKKNIVLLTLSGLLAIISIFAKPIFILLFIPSLIVYFLILKTKNNNNNNVIRNYIIAITTISLLFIIAIYQELYVTSSRGTSIIIAPLAVWNYYSSNILISIYVANLFLINFLILAFKHVSVRSFVATLMVIIAYAVLAIFAESRNGAILMDGNFGWLNLCAIPIAFLSILIDYFKKIGEISYWKVTALNLSFAIQTVFGFYYYYKFLTYPTIL